MSGQLRDNFSDIGVHKEFSPWYQIWSAAVIAKYIEDCALAGIQLKSEFFEKFERVLEATSFFIHPDSMTALYSESPEWLKSLMNAWADGLNYYLYTHPDVTPRVLTNFEPWMALTFTEGSIGGDIERVSLPMLEKFYGDRM